VYSSKSPQCNLPGWISASGCVSNAEGAGDGGYIDLWEATRDSVNVVFAQLALDVGRRTSWMPPMRWESLRDWTPCPRSR
jgi:hypothetical protein